MPSTLLRRRLLLLCLALCATLAQAQAYPTRPIKIVVTFPPGGSADLLARALGERLTSAMGQPVLVDNKPGAGGISGADFVVKAPADGYTLLFANTNIAINPSLYPRLPYDTARALEPVILLATVPSLILAPARSPANTIQELIALAKSRPGGLNYGSAGSGTFPHLAIEMLKAQAGISVTHIPYRGAAPALNALLSGDIDLLCNDMLTGTQQGMDECFGSPCHGAGRAKSRNSARTKLEPQQVLESLKAKGLAIRRARAGGGRELGTGAA